MGGGGGKNIIVLLSHNFLKNKNFYDEKNVFNFSRYNY